MDKPFHSTYQQWQQIPKYWLEAWFIQHVSGVTRELLDDLAVNDVNVIRKFLELHCGINSTDHIPRECLDKGLMSQVLLAVSKEMKSRISQRWLESHVRGGKVDWAAGGVWRLIEGHRIEHSSGVATESINALASLEEQQAVVCNWSDRDAKISADVIEFTVLSRFKGKDTLPFPAHFEEYLQSKTDEIVKDRRYHHEKIQEGWVAAKRSDSPAKKHKRERMVPPPLQDDPSTCVWKGLAAPGCSTSSGAGASK